MVAVRAFYHGQEARRRCHNFEAHKGVGSCVTGQITQASSLPSVFAQTGIVEISNAARVNMGCLKWETGILEGKKTGGRGTYSTTTLHRSITVIKRCEQRIRAATPSGTTSIESVRLAGARRAANKGAQA